MIHGIDHLVIACADPDAAATAIQSALGLAAGGGGRHEGQGTFNRIVWLADGSYLELIGVDDADAASRQPVGAAAVRALETHGGGLATYALRDDDLETTVATHQTFGSAVHGSRVRPDGDRAEWWAAFPEGPLGPDATPFLIEHAYVGSEWGLEAMAERARYAHPIGSPVVLARLDVAADQPPLVAATLHEELALDFWAVADLAVADIGPHVLRFVPLRETPVPAVITLGAEIDSPRTVDLLGLRFDVERVELPSPVPEPS